MATSAHTPSDDTMPVPPARTDDGRDDLRDDPDDTRAQLEGIRGLLERQERDRATDRQVRTDRILGLVGSVLVPGGIVAILLGWFGASRTPYQFEQIPYLISGGLLGVAMVIGGGLLFFGSWVARLERGDETEQIVASLDRLRQELARRPVVAGAGAASAPNGAAPGLVATPTGTMLHRLDCAVVASRDRGELVDVAPDAAGYQPCKLCGPLDD